MKAKIDTSITLDELQFIERIKKLTIIAMFSDDDLMEMFVLKGGNAMNIIYKIADRASIDLDFSMASDFREEELGIIKEKIVKTLQNTFSSEGYKVFDIEFTPQPLTSTVPYSFWGGYRIFFKLIEKKQYEENDRDIASVRRRARKLGINGKKKFQIDISKFEYCEQKAQSILDGYTVYVYTPEMIVFEKVRAICQQMPEYKNIIQTMTSAPRAKDFFDIYIILDKFPFDILDEGNISLLKTIFEIKKVPFSFLGRIHEYREYHRLGFDSLRATVRSGLTLKEFDYYFDYVVERFGNLT